MRAILVLGIVFACAGPARAEDAKTDARARFEAGKTAFRLGNFDQAIAEWRAGYSIKPDPVFLFNIGQAQREKGDFEAALFSYEQYLKEAPKAANRATVEGHMRELQRLLDEQQAQRKAPPTGPIDPGRPPPEEDRPRDRSRGRSLQITGAVVGGVGAALLVTGIVLGLSASSTADEVQAAIDGGETWTQELADKDAAGRRNATLGTVGMIAGGTALVGGAVLFVIGTKQRRESRLAVMPMLLPGAGLVVRGRF